jgi:DNA-binding GntR family transcriptional regulator
MQDDNETLTAVEAGVLDSQNDAEEEKEFDSLPLTRRVAAQIRDMIIEDRIQPGERIRERPLAETLNVSRTPLREALKLLEREKLIELRPNRGAVVTDPPADEIRGLLEVLGALEGLAGQLAAMQGTDQQIAEIRALHYEMLAAYTRKDKLKSADP